MEPFPLTVRGQAMKALAFLLAVAPSLAFAAPLKPGDEIYVPRASGQALTLRVTIALPPYP
ncbi:MAG: hypothetical protein PUJ80_09230 [Verrucomicrobiota bacterium]|nr:hypothetical protein [Verrucomicrobiota bacterium]